MDIKIRKLLSKALHPITPIQEAETVAAELIRTCRNHGITPDYFINPYLFSGEDKTRYAEPPKPPQPIKHPSSAPSGLIFPIGKYIGHYLDEILKGDQQYCLWAIEHMTALPKIYRDYLCEKLGSSLADDGPAASRG